MGPRGTAAVGGAFAQDPSQAEGLDPHEDRLAAAEDLIQTQANDQRATGPVEDLQQPAGTASLLLHPAPQGRTTRPQCGGQENGQQGEGLLQAEAQGGCLHGELPALGLGALEALVQPVPQLLVLLAQALVLGKEVFAGRARPLGVGDGVLDLLGMVVGGLPTTTALLGVAGDVAVGAKQHGGGVAEAGEQG